MLTIARGIHLLLCIVSLTTASIAPAEAQTTKQAPRPKATNPTSHEKSLQELPFADARNMAVTVMAAFIDIGSGVWIGKNGYVVTCQHVIASKGGPYEIGLPAKAYVSKDGSIVTLNVSQIFGAELIDEDVETDVAILKVTKKMDQIRAEAALPLMPAGTSPSIIPQDPVVPRGAILASNIPDLGESLFVAGFPLGGRTLILRKAAATAVVLAPHPPNGAPSKRWRIALFRGQCCRFCDAPRPGKMDADTAEVVGYRWTLASREGNSHPC